MIGVFVQVNLGSLHGIKHPIGYVVCENGCWEWVGFRSKDGYGRMAYGRGQAAAAHRILWIKAHGEVPSGMQLDHLCRNRACVRPDHLEPVTLKENVLRGVGVGVQNSRKTHCPAGHEYTAENTRLELKRSGGTARRCRSCSKRAGPVLAHSANSVAHRVKGKP